MIKASLLVCALGASTVTASAGADMQPPPPASNPTAYSPASVARGKSHFLQNCQSCHDEDGRARSAAVAIAADLTEPARWKFGTGDGQVFSTIKNGAGDNMPPFGGDLKDEQIWDIVNFIRSIGPEGNKPQSK
jgi:mono/diheme cytochrome c family protein